MSKYLIAKHYFEIEFINKDYLSWRFRKYATDNEKEEFKIVVRVKEQTFNFSDLKKSNSYYKGYENGKFVQIPLGLDGEVYGKITYDKNVAHVDLINDDITKEIIMVQYAFNHLIEECEQAFLIHGSSILYRDNGYLFTAPSGTGKSTHTNLWKELYGVLHINDDKNTILIENNELYLYGTPFSGKHGRDNPIHAPLKAVIFLQQGKINEVSRLTPKEAFVRLITQVVQPADFEELDHWNYFVDRLISLPCFLLTCDISYDAVKIIEKELLSL